MHHNTTAKVNILKRMDCVLMFATLTFIVVLPLPSGLLLLAGPLCALHPLLKPLLTPCPHHYTVSVTPIHNNSRRFLYLSHSICFNVFPSLYLDLSRAQILTCKSRCIIQEERFYLKVRDPQRPIHRDLGVLNSGLPFIKTRNFFYRHEKH